MKACNGFQKLNFKEEIFMSRSKNKIAVTTLLSALACSTTASAAGPNGKDIKNVESQTSFSTRKSSESSIKSARSLEGARSWFQKIPTWAKITALVSAPILAAEIYNEIAGAVSGKKWYSGKYSFVNLARGKGEDESPEPNEYSSTVKKSENQDKTDNNIEGKIKNKIYTNLDDTNLINKKDNTGFGAASVQEAEIKKRNLKKIYDALDEEFASNKNLDNKGKWSHMILAVFETFPKVKNLGELIKNKKNSNLVEYNVKDFEDLAMLCENKLEIQSIKITFESFFQVKIAIDEKKGYYIKVYDSDKVNFGVCAYQNDEEDDPVALIGDWIEIN